MTIKSDTVTVITPGTVTDRGTTLPDWDTATTADYDECRVQPLSADEITALGRQGVRHAMRLFGPEDMTINELDRVTAGGVTYEVDSAQVWPSPTGRLAHTEAVLVDVEG